MRVLITGGCGFLGSHVAEHFRREGDEVVVLDNLARHELALTGYDLVASRNHNLEFIKSIGCEFVKDDVTKSMDKPFMKDVDYIVHCAAQPAMTIATQNPMFDLKTNIIGTVNVLDIAQRRDIPVANCSSIHIYGNDINKNLVEEETRFTNTPEAFDEDYPILNGDMTPLHASKRSAELYVQTYVETYGLRATTFRLTGMYGPRQFGGMDHGWVANFAIRTIIGRPIYLFGTGKQVRDILYASDAARAFDLWFERGKSEIYNIGGGMDNAISLQECIWLIEDTIDIEADVSLKDPRFGDLYYFVCDSSKANRHFGWKPEVSNYEGIFHLTEWIKDNRELFG